MPNVPIDKVLQLRSQGYTNSQIVETLRREGIPPAMINEAISHADAKSSVDGNYSSQQNSGNLGNVGQQQAEYPENSSEEETEDDGEEIEQLIEEIIEEKWKELVKDIKKIVEWKDKTDEKVSKLEQSFTDLKSNFENLHKALLGKIGEYDKNILEVGTDIKAMEKVFEKVLPRFTENVNELSRITKTIKLSYSEDSNK